MIAAALLVLLAGRSRALPAEFTAVEARLDALAAAAPELVELRAIGNSESGAPLRVAILGARAEGLRPTDDRPSLLVLPDLASADVAAAETVCALLEELVGAARVDAGLAERLTRTSLFALCVPLPDGAAGAIAPESDFPCGWTPFGASGDARRRGPWPLARAETRALVDWLDECPATAIALELGGVAGEPAAGSFAAFVVEARGIQHGTVGAATLSARAQEGLAALPDVSFSAPLTTRLGESLWLLEVRLENAGHLPEAAADSAVPGRILLRGLDCRAAMILRAPARSFVPLSSRRNWVDCPLPAGGANVLLRLVVQGAADATGRLEYAAPRSGVVAALDVALSAPSER